MKITIPPEALEAAKAAWYAHQHMGTDDRMTAVCLAMLENWPGMSTEWREHVTFTSQYGERILYAVLPLPKEKKIMAEAADEITALRAEVARLNIEVDTLRLQRSAKRRHRDALRAEVADLQRVVAELNSGRDLQRVMVENERLRAALGGIKWQSADRDNMEFSAKITCYQIDEIRAALEEKS